MLTFSEVSKLADRLHAKLCRHHPMGYVPKLVWKNLRVSAGIAKYHERTIVLSKLLVIDEDRLSSTLKHEYAHLLAVARHGRRAAGHGWYWKEAMLDLGEEPEVRHCYPVIRNGQRQEVGYRCRRCGSLLTRVRKLPRGRRYYHVSCGGSLALEYIRNLEGEYC